MKISKISFSQYGFFYIFKILSCLVFCLILFSCTDKSKIKDPISKIENPQSQIPDDAGVMVNFDSIPKRIISLAPNITETIYAIHADSLLAGVSEFCTYPPEAKTKANTGSYLSPDYEKIVSLNPDLVLINVENTSNPTYQSLKNLGLKLFLSNAKDINGIKKMVSDLGSITGNISSSDSLIEILNKGMVISDTSAKDDMNSMIIISINPLMTTNGKTFINEITGLAGLTNVYSDEIIDYPSVSFEDVLKKNPDWIVFPADTSNAEQLINYRKELTSKLGETNAVKNGKVIFIDENVMFRPGPRVLDAAELLKQKIDQMNN